MGLVFLDNDKTPTQNGAYTKVNSTVVHPQGSVGVVFTIIVKVYESASGSSGDTTSTTFTYTTTQNDTASDVANSLRNQINSHYSGNANRIIASATSGVLTTEQTSVTPSPYGFEITTSEDHSSVTVFSESDYITALARDTGKVDFHSATASVWSDTVMDLTSDQASGTYFPVFYSADGECRVSDAKLSSNTRPKALYYMDYLAAGDVSDATPDGTNTAGWAVDVAYNENTSNEAYALKRPSTQSALSGNNDEIAAGSGKMQFNWWEETDGNSTWGTGAYPIYYTIKYGKQISVPRRCKKNDTTNEDLTMSGSDKVPRLLLAWANGKTMNSFRVTGFQFFLRYEGQLYFLAEADKKKGIRVANKTKWIDWETGDSNYQWARTEEIQNPILVETFDTMNGYSWRLPTNGFDSYGTGFRTGCVANRKSWVGNVKIKDRDGIVQTLPDAVIKSPVNQFDVFPYDNIIEPVVNDGSEVTALYEYADRLLMFKNIDLYIINIGGQIEYLEQKVPFAGVHRPQQACNTPYGICWINPRGIYIYNGKNVSKLNEKQGRNILSDDQLQAFSGTYSAIGFDFKLNKLFLRGGYEGGTEALIYDFTTMSWAREEGAYTGTRVTNFSTDRDGRLIWGRHIGTGSPSSQDIQSVEDTSKAQWGTLETGYIDFGDPASFKQLMSVYITYTTGEATEPANYTTHLNGEVENSQIRIYLLNEKGEECELKKRNSKELLVDAITDDGKGRAVLKYTNLKQTASLKLSSNKKRRMRAVKVILTGYFPEDFELDDISITFKPKKPK